MTDSPSPILQEQDPELGQAKIVSSSDDLMFHGVDVAATNEMLLERAAGITSAPPLHGEASAVPGTITPMERVVSFHTDDPTQDPIELLENTVPQPAHAPEIAPPPSPQTETSQAETSLQDEAPPSSEPPRPVAPSNPLSKEVIAGLSLRHGTSSISVLQYRSNRLHITRTGTIKINLLENPNDAARALKEQWKKSRIPTRSVWANIHSRLMIQKFFCLKLTEENLQSALLIEAEELLQIAQKDLIVDYHLNDQRGPNDELCGMMYAIPRWELLTHLNILRKAGLFICGISSPACDLAALYKQVCPTLTRNNPVQAIICLTESSADLVFLYGKNSMYSRTVFSTARNWASHISYLAQSINDAIMYFGHWVSPMPVSQFFLTGIIPDDTDLCGLLLRETGIPVYAWDPCESDAGIILDKSAGAGQLDPSTLTSSIAVALRRD